jgi:hypothetical protein
MEHLFALRLLMAAAIMFATTAGTLAFAFMKFPGNAVVIFLSVAAAAGVVVCAEKALAAGISSANQRSRFSAQFTQKPRDFGRSLKLQPIALGTTLDFARRRKF